MSLWAELKRRQVFKVGAVYGVVAWLLIQIATTLLPTFGAPDWTAPVFVAIVILGFPIALVLAWAYEITPDGIKTTSTSPLSTQRTADRAFNYLVIGLLAVAIAFFALSRPKPTALSGSLDSVALAHAPIDNASFSRRSLINLGHTVPLRESRLDASIALSPDGRRLAYVAQRDNTAPQLYLQDLDQLEARPIPGTGEAENPFFSPDGEWIGFGSAGANGSASLNKVSVRGGPPQTLVSSIRAGTGGFWARDDQIYFTSDETDGLRLRRTPATGSASDALKTSRTNTELAHTWPYLLPDGDTLLFTNRPVGGKAADGRIDMLRLSTGHVETIIPAGYNARYVPTGHIVFMRSGTLWAVPFDPDRHKTVGPEVPIVQDVQTAGSRGEAAYAFSNDGLLVYRAGRDTQAASTWKTLLWVDPEGQEEELELPRDYRVAAVSPEGKRIAVEAGDAGNGDIWIYDLERSTLSRLTFDPNDDFTPLWTPDGQRVVYGSDRDGGLWWRAADGTGQEESLVAGVHDGRLRPMAFSPDGSELVYQAGNPADLFVISLDGDAKPRPLLHTGFTETMASISPNGRWIAYVSNEAAELLQVYVRPFPDIDGGKWQISMEGGIWPKWDADGTALYFVGISGGVSVWAAAVDTEGSFQFQRPRRLFSGKFSESGLYQLTFDISPVGPRFLLARDETDSSEEDDYGLTQLVAVDNWFDELRRLAPVAERNQLAVVTSNAP